MPFLTRTKRHLCMHTPLGAPHPRKPNTQTVTCSPSQTVHCATRASNRQGTAAHQSILYSVHFCNGPDSEQHPPSSSSATSTAWWTNKLECMQPSDPLDQFSISLHSAELPALHGAGTATHHPSTLPYYPLLLQLRTRPQGHPNALHGHAHVVGQTAA